MVKLRLYSCADQQQLRHLSTVNSKISNQTHDDDDNDKKLLRVGEVAGGGGGSDDDDQSPILQDD